MTSRAREQVVGAVGEPALEQRETARAAAAARQRDQARLALLDGDHRVLARKADEDMDALAHQRRKRIRKAAQHRAQPRQARLDLAVRPAALREVGVDLDAFLLEGREDVFEHGRLAGLLAQGVLADLREDLPRRQAVGEAARGRIAGDLRDLGHADHVELVQVRADDRREPQALERRHRLGRGLGQDAIVERQPRQVAVEEALGRLQPFVGLRGGGGRFVDVERMESRAGHRGLPSHITFLTQARPSGTASMNPL